MKASDIKVELFGDRQICIGGVGTLFHQEGFPIGMSARQLANKNIELSWFHVVKELRDNFPGRPERLFAKIEAEINDAKVENIVVDLEIIKKFIYAEYEDGQAMIFDYLFGGNLEIAKTFAKNKLS